MDPPGVRALSGKFGIPSFMNNIVSIARHPDLTPLWKAAQEPWSPILWHNATFLTEYPRLEQFLLDADARHNVELQISKIPRQLMSKFGIEACLEAPTTSESQRATQSANSLWIPIQHLPPMVTAAYSHGGQVACWCYSCKALVVSMKRLSHRSYEVSEDGGCEHISGTTWLAAVKAAEAAALSQTEDPRLDLVGQWRAAALKASRQLCSELNESYFDSEEFLHQFEQFLSEVKISQLVGNAQTNVVLQGHTNIIRYELFSKQRRSRLDSDERFFHGVFGYAFPHIVYERGLRASDNRSLGHDFSHPGVYLSPYVTTALQYARPHVLFPGWRPQRFFFEVYAQRGDASKKIDANQIVFSPEMISIEALLVIPSASVEAGEECFLHWDSLLEINIPSASSDIRSKKRRPDKDRTQVPPLPIRLAFGILEASHARVRGTQQAQEYEESCHASYSNVPASLWNTEAFVKGKAFGLAKRLLMADALDFHVVGGSEAWVARRKCFIETFQRHLWDVIPTQRWGIRLTWYQCYWIAEESVDEVVSECKDQGDQIGTERGRTKMEKILWQD